MAWEVGGDRRFNPAAITVNKLLAAIADSASNVVISSEDFESLLTRPIIFRPFIDALKAEGRTIFLVIYQRDATDYAESLYIELLDHGYTRSFSNFVDEIRTTGVLKFKEWVFQFDEESTRSALAELAAVGVIYRSYDAIENSGSTIADFLSVIGLEGVLPSHATNCRSNVRPSLEESLTRFCIGVFGRPLLTPEKRLIGGLCHAACGVRLGAGSQYRLSARQPRLEPTARLERVCSRPTAALIRHFARVVAVSPSLSKWVEMAVVSWWTA